MSIGERITELRKARNLSQGKLAEMMDVSRQAVSKWETDQASPDTIRLIKLADALDTDVEYLATGNHSKIKEPPQVVTVVRNVDRVVEKPVVVEKIVEVPVEVEKETIKYVEKPIVHYVDKPSIKRVQRIKYLRNPVEFAIVGTVTFLLGLLIGIIL